MRKIIVWMLLVLLFVHIGAISEVNTIQKGDSGNSVLAIQKILSSLNYLSAEYVTGDYEDMTELAVLAFQLDNGIEPTGIADPDTQRAITNSMKDQNAGSSAVLGETDAQNKAEDQNEEVEQYEVADQNESGSTHDCTPLSDFYLNLNSNGTITLKSFEVHDRECYIPTYYVVDGKKYTVSNIDDACFFGRTSLEILSLPEGVKTIAHNAFNSCAVKTLYLPASLKDITGIFEYLNRNITIYYAGSPDQWRKVKGSAKRPENVTLKCNTPVIDVADETNYSSASLVTEMSQAEELGSAFANALNGFVMGFSEGLTEGDD